MRFSSAFLAIAAAPLLAYAQGTETSNGSNPFNIPTTSLNTEAGETVNLTWKPTTEGTVTIYLRSGASNALNKGVAIASNIDNSGKFTWDVPSDIVRGSNYALEIVDDADDKNTNYTPPFVIESTNNAAPSASDSSSSASASASATKSSSAASSMATESATDAESSTTSTDSSSTTAAVVAAVSSATHHSNGTSGLTTSTSTRSSPSSTSSSDADATSVVASEGGAARTSAFIGLIGLVALGAFAL